MSPLVNHSTRYASVYATHVDLSLAAAACVVLSALAVCVGMDMMIMFTAGRGLHHAQLNRRLADTFWVHFVPPWPRKNTIENQVMQRDEFVAQLHVALERYLWWLAEHPTIGPSDELRVFLQAEGKMPLSGSTDVASRMLDGPARLPRQLPSGEEDVVQPAKGGRDLLMIFKELKQSVVIDWADVKPPLVEEEREFLEKEKLHEWERQLTSASQQAETLVTAQQDMGETTRVLRLAFIKLTKFETDEAMYDSQRIRAADRYAAWSFEHNVVCPYCIF
ncbi:sorting nexin 2B-like isoform X2 [Phragmites australis]|uniref:sorting nexin 2B-like isoform X2 n=1 Tax=Phragmites australis TaxID=29695 RepID=UPI002D79A31C|nr:sorting nexin 2B-like isoform X2 [Phragmites australis]XP_062229730.1 sorting nexin 2B-like isoform X2 [Phragmites australis]